MSDLRKPKLSAYYDSQEFYDRWHSHETIESIAGSLDRTVTAVYRAAMHRGFPLKKEARKK